ncbi:hypothetical protein HQ399_07280 [Aeromonas jandaei]|jgi:hypothetical protein|uniref:Uncharacterized protein n=1 Tax=Aeromonas jandaei TaxID=650 RepID=A0ABD7EM33_AERJA|nr:MULTISPECIES: hypothetical protein [Aeromonas]QWL62063.1 hypothetical protein HQ399_07280 [Aeromonas jandaei]
MSRTLEEILKSEPSTVVHKARKMADEQLIKIQLCRLLSHLDMDAIFETDTEIVNDLLDIKQLVESCGGRLNLFVHMPDGTHHGVKI